MCSAIIRFGDRADESLEFSPLALRLRAIEADCIKSATTLVGSFAEPFASF